MLWPTCDIYDDRKNQLHQFFFIDCVTHFLLHVMQKCSVGRVEYFVQWPHFEWMFLRVELLRKTNNIENVDEVFIIQSLIGRSALDTYTGRMRCQLVRNLDI